MMTIFSSRRRRYVRTTGIFFIRLSYYVCYIAILCTQQETLSIGTLRARAFEAQTWVKVQLDNLGALPDEDSDRDLEAG